MLSPIKIILLILVIVGVFAISKIVRKNIAGRQGNDEIERGGSRKSPKSSTDLVQCPKCETFVASLEDHSCDS
ncbi:MAG: hypothetical protein V7727_05070 [Sneathiella sp.]